MVRLLSVFSGSDFSPGLSLAFLLDIVIQLVGVDTVGDGHSVRYRYPCCVRVCHISKKSITQCLESLI